MRIFVRVFIGFWLAVIAMVALTAAAISTSSPFQANRFRTVSVDEVQACAQHEMELHKTGTKRAAPQATDGCNNGLLIQFGGAILPETKLSREDAQLVKEIENGKTLMIGTSPMGTSVALRLDPQSGNPLIYLARIPVSRHPFTQMLLNSLGRLILVGGVFCYLLTTYFIRPITTLNRAAEEFGAGDLKRRVPDSTSLRTDEFGELGRAFNQMATRIESLVVRYKTFLAQASHEIGSPLTRLNIALALARRTAGPQLHAELGRIGHEADSLNSLVHELLLLARLESGNELTQEAVVYDVASVVDEVYANASFEAKERNKSVIMLKRESFQLVGYPKLLQRALDNVLRNGLRFCRPEGCVQVSFFKDVETAIGTIVIQDDGDGVPAGKEEIIFEAFVTGSGEKSEAGAGSGLGLAIARQAVLAHHGTIHANNSLQGGLSVTIELPIDRNANLGDIKIFPSVHRDLHLDK
ncbi:MAG: integral rane sensor signal transduction histidine kinase [Edaphobacter sp.]|nr:integral rane sensor signal transduction histidine kinase [Edaphobacter sp.]